MKTTVDITALVNAAVKRSNWTGLNAIQLAQAGRLTGGSIRNWATAAANEDSAQWFDADDLNTGMDLFDRYVSEFVALVDKAIER